MDAAGIKPDMIIGEVGAGRGRSIYPERMRRDAAQTGFEVVRIEDFLQ